MTGEGFGRGQRYNIERIQSINGIPDATGHRSRRKRIIYSRQDAYESPPLKRNVLAMMR